MARMDLGTSLGVQWLGLSTFTAKGARLVSNWGTKIPQFRVVVEKAMATHSSTLAWKIPGTEEPGRLQSMGWRRVGHN